MNKLVFACIAAALIAAPMATIVKAEETTVIKREHGDRDNTVIKEREGDGDRTVIKKREELNVLPVPHTEEKTIIKKERD
jgi:Ni/Co efflux regulator RcnB